MQYSWVGLRARFLPYLCRIAFNELDDVLKRSPCYLGAIVAGLVCGSGCELDVRVNMDWIFPLRGAQLQAEDVIDKAMYASERR